MVPLRLRGLVLAALLAAVCSRPAGAANAAIPVSLELVLAIDASLSVDDGEFDLQLRGIAKAFRDPTIMALIGQHAGGVAVTLVQWSGWAESLKKPPWHLLSDAPSSLAFADAVERVGRARLGYLTGIGHAIDFSVELIEENGFHGKQRKIDVSGDGRSNAGPEPVPARASALARGITINGLAILTDDPDLRQYYNDSVIGGPAAFVMSTASYSDFADAIAAKLARELTLNIASGALPEALAPTTLSRLGFPLGGR